MTTKTYVDEKGQKRWRRNDEVATVVKQLGEYLVIGGYPEEHANPNENGSDRSPPTAD